MTAPLPVSVDAGTGATAPLGAFAGKWAFTTSAGTAVTLKNPASGVLGLSPAGPSVTAEQRLNGYGDPTTGFVLQCDNGKYLVAGGDGWLATASQHQAHATFTLEPLGGDNYRVLETAGRHKFYMSADGDALRRIPAGQKPDCTNFSQVVITYGLDDLLTYGGNGHDLRWVTFAGCDIRDIILMKCDLSKATLAGATVTGAVLQNSKLDHADLSGLDLEDVTASGVTGEAPDFSNTTLHDSTTFQGARIPRAKFKNATSKGSGPVSGPDLGNVIATRADFSGAVLTGSTAAGSDFTGSDFTGVNLSCVQCAGTKFTDTKMNDVLFTKAVLTDAVFDKAQLVLATFAGAEVTDCSFVKANLTNSKLSEVDSDIGQLDLKGATLTGAVLSGLDLTTAILDAHTVFRNSRLNDVKLTGQTLDHINFCDANLCDANLDLTSAEHTNFTSADLSRVSALAGRQGVSFVGCNLSNAKLPDAKLTGARFGAQEKSSAAVLSNTFMRNADLTSANLASVDLSGVQWYGPNAKGQANLRNANLSRANLATLNLSQATMNGVDLSSANLVNANLSGALLAVGPEQRATSLTFASLQGADLTQAKLPGANLTDAAVALSIDWPTEPFVGVPLFTLPTSVVSDLDQAKVSNEVKTQFSEAGYPLIDVAKATCVAAGKQWSIDNWDQSGDSGLQSGYGTFSLARSVTKREDVVRVYGSSPLLAIAVDETNQRIQLSPAFTETRGLTDTFDDDTTCPSGMRWSARNEGFDIERIMTPALPPHPPQCVPTPTHWC